MIIIVRIYWLTCKGGIRLGLLQFADASSGSPAPCLVRFWAGEGQMGTSGWKRRTSEQPYNTLQECVVPYGLLLYYNTPSMMSVFVLLASVGTQWGNDANGSLDTEHQRLPVFCFVLFFLSVVIFHCSQHICLWGFNTLFVILQQPEGLKKSNLALEGILISAETIIIIIIFPHQPDCCSLCTVDEPRVPTLESDIVLITLHNYAQL